MRIPRLLTPLLLTVALVGCDAWLAVDTNTGTGAVMEGSSSSERTEEMMVEDADVSSNDDDTVEATSSRGASSSHGSDTAMPAAGSYGDYSPSVLTNGRTKVLFFHAAWCPTCRTADTQLTAWYATHPFPVSVYKVDFDTELELRQRYGVTRQHTYVLVDGDGDPLKILEGPTDAALQGMLQS